MAKLTIDVEGSIKDGMHSVIKKCLLKNGFDYESENNFNLLSRVNLDESALYLDGKIILHISPIKIENIEGRIKAYIEYCEPGNNNVTKQ